MTVHDSESVDLLSSSDSSKAGSPLGCGTVSPASVGLTAYVPEDAPHQVVDCFASVVSGDVCMHLPPHALDAVVLRAVRGQEVQHEPAGMLTQELLHASTGVNAVVVEDQVDTRRPPMPSLELLEERQEQVAVLALRLHDQQVRAVDRKRPGEIALAVLSG